MWIFLRGAGVQVQGGLLEEGHGELFPKSLKKMLKCEDIYYFKIS